MNNQFGCGDLRNDHIPVPPLAWDHTWLLPNLSMRFYNRRIYDAFHWRSLAARHIPRDSAGDNKRSSLEIASFRSVIVFSYAKWITIPRNNDNKFAHYPKCSKRSKWTFCAWQTNFIYLETSFGPKIAQEMRRLFLFPSVHLGATTERRALCSSAAAGQPVVLRSSSGGSLRATVTTAAPPPWKSYKISIQSIKLLFQV